MGCVLCKPSNPFTSPLRKLIAFLCLPSLTPLVQCNGFSAGVNPDDFRGAFKSGYEPVWADLYNKHMEEPFHMLMGGGDQLYCDGVAREPELKDWMFTENQETKKNYQLTPEILSAIDRFYFNHYCDAFRSGIFGKLNSRMLVRLIPLRYQD